MREHQVEAAAVDVTHDARGLLSDGVEPSGLPGSRLQDDHVLVLPALAQAAAENAKGPFGKFRPPGHAGRFERITGTESYRSRRRAARKPPLRVPPGAHEADQAARSERRGLAARP